MRGSSVRWTAWAGVLALAVAACGGGGSGPARGSGDPVVVSAPPRLSGAELRYGASASESDRFTYQPDVVVLGGGADSIRASSPDGLLWTIKGDAPHADELVPGKIMLATSFAAGRVLAVKQVGRDKQIALGPVALTDVIRDGSFETDAPIPLDDFQVLFSPDRPGLEPTPGTDSQIDGSAAVSRASFAPDGGHDAVLVRKQLPTVARASAPQPPWNSDVGGWHVQSSCCTSAEVHVTYDKGGARVAGTFTIGFDKPSIGFSLRIGGGHLVDASVDLRGGAHLGFGISAAVQGSSADFRSGRVELPVDIAIPVPVAGLPLTIGVHQVFSVNLGLSGQASLSTSGAYAITGTLGFHVVDGSVSFGKVGVTTTKSALDNVQSLAVAPQGLTVAHAVKLSIGIGTPWLNAGIWYQVSAALALATSGARLDPLQGTSLATCKTVTLSVQSRYGVGYTIPNLVAAAINLFLKVFAKHATPVQPTGGPSWGPSDLFTKSTPPCSKS